MLDARYVTEHFEEVEKALARRSPAAAADLGEIASLAKRRRELIGLVEERKARRNAANQAMAKLAKGPDRTQFEARRDELKALSDQIKTLESELTQIEGDVEERLLLVPNLPHASVP